MSGLPPGLEDFGRRLEQAAERDVAARRRQRLSRRARGVGLAGAAALVAAAVSAGAVRIADRGGERIAPPEQGGGVSTLHAARDPAVVMATATADPSGGPPWVVRAFTNAAGRPCVYAGQLRNGVFGRIQGGRFRALPAGTPGALCAHADDRGPLLVVSRDARRQLTLVFGLAIDRSPVTVRVGRRERRVQPAGFGAFMTVFSGADPRERIVVRSKVGGRDNVQRPR
jgi:hypothetical protein